MQGVGLSVGSQRNLSNSFIVDGLSSNDDAAGLSRYAVRGGRGRAVPGGHLRRPGRTRARARRLCQRGDAQRHQRCCAAPPTATSATMRFNAANALSGTTLPMSQQQFGASLGGPLAKGRTFYFANVEQRLLDQVGLSHHQRTPTSRSSTHDLAAVGYPGSLVTTGLFDQPIDSLNVLGKVDHAFNGRDQLSVRYSLYDVTSRNSRGAGGLSAPSASAGLDNRDQAIAFSNTLTLGARTVNETRAQFTNSDLLALPTDPVGPGGQHRRRRVVRHVPVEPAGAAEHGCSRSPNNRFAAARRARAARRRGLHLQRRPHPIPARRARLVRLLVAGHLPDRHLQQRRLLADVRRDGGRSRAMPTLGVYAQDEWSVDDSGLTLNLGLRYDLQFLDTIDTDANNVSPRAGFAWTPSGSRNLVVRGSAGLFFDRVPLRAVANALLSANNTTDLGQLQQVNVSLSPGAGRRAAVPGHPAGAGAAGHARQPDDDAARPAERLLAPGQRRSGAAGRAARHRQRRLLRTCAATGLLMAINQNVPSCAPAGTNNGCRPDSRLRQQQPVFVGGRVRLPRAARVVHAASVAVGLLPRQLHALEGREQRRRVLLQRADRSLRPLEGLGPLGQRPPPPVRVLRRREHVDERPPPRRGRRHPRLPAERAAAGVLGGAVQHHVRGHDDPGHGRPAASWTASTSRATPESATSSSVSALRVSRSIPAGRPHAARGDGRGVQPDQCGQRDHAQHELRYRRLSDQPVAHASTRSRPSATPRSWQFALRLRF